jgi:hypothetical protein
MSAATNRLPANKRADLASRELDLLYGLEPVFEPGAHAALESWTELQCPYCGETSGSVIDLTDRSRTYIEDCQVCCQPMQVNLRVDRAGRLRQVSTGRLDE